jgi:hypothetical protein
MLHLSSVFVCLVSSYTGLLFTAPSLTIKGHIQSQQIYSLKFFKHASQIFIFFLSTKCHVFHNFTYFGSKAIHILHKVYTTIKCPALPPKHSRNKHLSRQCKPLCPNSWPSIARKSCRHRLMFWRNVISIFRVKVSPCF